MHRRLAASAGGDHRLHRLGIFGAEIENVADLDAARRHLLVGGDFPKRRGVVHVGRGGVLRRPFVDDRLQAFDVVEIHVGARTAMSR